MATSTIVKENNTAQAQGSTSVTLATTDKNAVLATLTPSNDFCSLTSNGALTFTKSGRYLLLGCWGFNGLSSGNVLTASIRKWVNGGYQSVDSWGFSVGGAYFSFNAFITVDISAGEALFMSARNNSSATGSFNFARLTVIRL